MPPGVVKISEVVGHADPFAAGEEVYVPGCEMEAELAFRIYAGLQLAQDMSSPGSDSTSGGRKLRCLVATRSQYKSEFAA